MVATIFTSVALVVGALALFVLPSLPRWIWPILAWCVLVSDLPGHWRLRPPVDRGEHCAWACGDRFPKPELTPLSYDACRRDCTAGRPPI